MTKKQGAYEEEEDEEVEEEEEGDEGHRTKILV